MEEDMRAQDEPRNVIPLRRKDVEEFLISHLLNTNLLRKGKSAEVGLDYKFGSNEKFWSAVLKEHVDALRWIELENFQITDWYPRAPGLFHTRRARRARLRAHRFVRVKDGITHYSPRGKVSMMEGGIGSIRFKPRPIEGEDCWLCSATSDQYSHSGIPLAIPDRIFSRIRNKTQSLFSIVGQLRFLPGILEDHFYHVTRIPQLYVLVDSITETGRGDNLVRITPMVFFTGGEENWDHYGETVTYVNCLAGSNRELDEATAWLAWYVSTYGSDVITNFDEQRPTFEGAPFSLQAVMGGTADLHRLNEFHIYKAEIICDAIQNIYSEDTTMTQITVTLGDGTTIHGDFVVANSIKNSFNKAASAEVGEDLKSLLKDLASAVGKMTEALPQEEASEIARDLETFTAEATSSAPRKRWWELSIEGIKKAAERVGEYGKPVLEIVAKLLPLLGAAAI